jgi:tripartite ATP-independent transporter DctM subunit
MIVGLLFGLLFLLIALGLPIALSIGLPAIGLMLTPGVFPATVPIPALGQTIIQLLFAGVDSFDLLAVPLFMLAGAVMETGGISRQLIDFSDSLVGWVPGGLACACIVASMFFAGISGSAAADTAAIGAIVIPAMIRQGYPAGFAAAVVAAGGAIGVIIPPSIPMVIFGFLTNVSIAKLFAGGMMVGILFGVNFMLVAAWISWRRGYGLRQSFSAARLWKSLKEAVWAIGAPVIVLGGILSGIVTVTEAAALAVFYALFVSMVLNRELKWNQLPGADRALPDHGRHHSLHHRHGQGLHLAGGDEADQPAFGRAGRRPLPAAVGSSAAGHGGAARGRDASWRPPPP